MTNKFAFLSSTRFWALVVGAVSFYLKTRGILGESEMLLITTIMGGFITLNTVDKFNNLAVPENTPSKPE